VVSGRAARALLSTTLVVMVSLVGSAMQAHRPVYADDCDHSISACSALLSEEQAAAANQAQLAGIDQQIAYTTGALAALAAVVDDLQAKVAEQQSAVTQTGARLDDIARQIRFTQADLERTQAELSIREQVLSHRVRELDKVGGGVDYLQLLVTSTSFTQLVNRVATIQQLAGGDQELITGLKQDRSRVEQLNAQLAADQAKEQELLAQQQRQLAQLQAEQQSERQAYAAQAALQAQLQGRRQDLQGQQSAIGAQVQSLQADYQRQLTALQSRQRAGSGGGGGTFGIDTDLRIVPNVDPAALNAYFAGTAFAGLGPTFVRAGQQHGVNPLYLVAHAIEESAFGESYLAQSRNNLFGIGAFDSDPDAAASFPSFAACIDYQAGFVRSDYLDPDGPYFDGPTLRGMNTHYATDPHWARNIAAIYLTLPGGLNPVG